MSAMPKRFITVAIALFTLATPGWAQRGAERPPSRISSASAFRGFAGRRGYAGDFRYRRPYAGGRNLLYPYSVGWIGPDYFGYPGYWPDDSSIADSPAPPPDYPSPQYPSEDLQPGAPEPPMPVAYRPEYQRPQTQSPEPAEEDALTLIFKDGRPSEQIRNYMLTRTTLYVQGHHLRAIAVSDLDLEAMAKVNREAGVDFQLPAAAR
jgi:hypothetical protein